MATVPMIPSPNDPRFQEMLAKALAPPKAEPVKPATEGVLDLEALKREVSKAKAWIAENADKWMRLCEPAPAPAPAPPEPLREGGSFITRFFRRIADWFKKGLSRLREWFGRSKAAVEAPSGVNDSAPKPGSNSAPPQSVGTTEPAQATSATRSTADSASAPPRSTTTTEPAQVREQAPTSQAVARAEVMREVLSFVHRHVAGLGTETGRSRGAVPRNTTQGEAPS